MGGKRVMGNILRDFRHVITYRISPYEQRAFAGFFEDGAPNLVRRFFSNVPYIGPPLLVFLGIFYWMEKKSIEVTRKNPKDYEDEE